MNKKIPEVLPVNDEFDINSKQGSLLGSVKNPENSTDPFPQDRSGEVGPGVKQSADSGASQPDSSNASESAPKKSAQPIKRVLGSEN
jgi:hypothetical protein